MEEAPSLRKKFYKYSDYADATIEDIVGKKELANSVHLQTNMLQSVWIENKGNNHWQPQSLSRAVQCSMRNGFVIDDFNGDGKKELLCTGNFYPYRVEQGKTGAFMGALLSSSHGSAKMYQPDMSLWLTGDIRDVAVLHFNKLSKEILVPRNNDAPAVYIRQ